MRRPSAWAAVAAGAILSAAGPAGAAAHRVDVGGFKLNLRCDGEGSPAVVLDAGAGDTGATWDWVVPDVKKVTRVCVYDRAGLGKSDPGPKPRTSERIVGELRDLLVRGRVAPPYVMVGHSFGGLNVRLYAARNPDQVAGLVLVDATPVEYPGLEGSLLTTAEREKLRTARAVAPQALLDEIDSMPESAASVRAAPPRPTLPVVVLTATHSTASPAFRKAWTDMQQRMAAGFPHGRQVLAERSDHYIQFDQPELVVAAIKETVAAARAQPSPDRP